MKVAIVVFSPSGHTLQAAKMIQKCCEEKNAVVRLINSTGNNALLFDERKKEHLAQRLGEWDLLFIGGPIYAGHMERNVLNIIKDLPRPDDSHASLAVPFATYGGVHSSVALEEMGRALKRKTYRSLLGIKIAAKHTLTTTLSNVIYPDKPGKEEENIIRQAVDRVYGILEKGKEHVVDQSESFKYCPTKMRIMFKIFSQERIHGKFKKVAILQEKCTQCQQCVAVCPVNMFRMSDGKIVMEAEKSRCILCAECFHACPAGAIEHPYIEMARKRLQDGFAHLEEEPSAIYPKM